MEEARYIVQELNALNKTLGSMTWVLILILVVLCVGDFGGERRPK